MGLKDIVVAIDAAPAACRRIELAATLAERFAAHLIGLYPTVATQRPRRRGYFDYFDRSLLVPLEREYLARIETETNEARALFEEIARRHGLVAEWRSAAGDASDAAAMHGRYADLIVLGQPDPDDPPSGLFHPLPEEVAFAIGRPLLVVPYAGRWADTGRRVLIGWDASREATRAVNDAMPLLVEARSVTVLAIDPSTAAGGRGRHGEVPGADIGLHLARHGVHATIERTSSGGIGAGNVLLSRASDLEADLLVMGAYGHSRAREMLLGGATRTVLESMTLPVLMAH